MGEVDQVILQLSGTAVRIFEDDTVFGTLGTRNAVSERIDPLLYAASAA